MISLFIGFQPSQIGGWSMFIGFRNLATIPGDSGDHNGLVLSPGPPFLAGL